MIGKIGTAAAAGLTAALLFAGVAGAAQTDLTMVKTPADPCVKTDGANGVLPELPKLPGMDGVDTGSANPGAAKQPTDPEKCDDKSKKSGDEKSGTTDGQKSGTTDGQKSGTTDGQKSGTTGESGATNGD